MPAGASSTRRTRCGSTRCGCTRSGMIKSSPERDHRRGHRLALPQRAQARAEGVRQAAAGWSGLPRGFGNCGKEASMRIIQSRRDFLASASLATAPPAVLGARRSFADEGPPETTTLRIGYDSSICVAPNFIAEDLLRAEGFTDIHYVPHSLDAVARGDIELRLRFRSGALPLPRCRRADHGPGGSCIPVATSCSRRSPSEQSAS